MRVRDVLRLIEDNGWSLVATKGSHRQYKHPEKPGRITVAGNPGDELAPGTVNSILTRTPHDLGTILPINLLIFQFHTIKAEDPYSVIPNNMTY